MCERCQRNAPQLKTAAMELNPIAVSPQVWYLVGMDLIGPFKPSVLGYKFVLTMTDYFSKYVEATPIIDKSVDSVAKGIYKIYCRQGAPVHIITDQGKEFVNQVWVAIYSELYINIHANYTYIQTYIYVWHTYIAMHTYSYISYG